MYEVIGKWSHREFTTRLAWIEDQWDKPSRTDHYLMMIAKKIDYVLSKKGEPPTLKNYKLKFDKVHADAPVLSEEEKRKRSTAIAKATWAARLGLGGKKN